MLKLILPEGFVDGFSVAGLYSDRLMVAFITIMLTTALLCFVVSELTRNYSQVDKLWSIMPAIYGFTALVYYPSSRLWLMSILVTLWGFRLSFNFYRKGGYDIIPWRGGEDYRWIIMRNNPALRGRFRFGLFNLGFISFYQNLLIMLFSSPLIIAAQNGQNGIQVMDIIAALFMILFLVTESIADNQQYRFHSLKKQQKRSGDIYSESLKKGFLSEGLWGYVRHPNFASEQAIWISFYLFGVSASGQWLNWTIAGPVLLVILFQGSTRFTEKISSEKYPDYKEYQQRIPALLPMIFRKRKN